MTIHGAKEDVELYKFEFDVQKTSSLVSPYVGYIVFRYKHHTDKHGWEFGRARLVYDFHDGAWVKKDMQESDSEGNWHYMQKVWDDATDRLILNRFQ